MVKKKTTKKTEWIYFYGSSQYFKLRKKYGKRLSRAKPCGFTATGKKVYRVRR